MNNPFEEIQTRLSNIEDLLADMKSKEGEATQVSNENEYLTRKQAANKLNVTLPTLHSYTKQGLIKGHRFGGKVLYKSSELENALKEIKSPKQV